MSIHYRIIEQELIIVGHTYPHKELIKALGARFDRVDKAWKLTHTENNQLQVDQLCRQLGGGPLGAPAAAPASKPSQVMENADPAGSPTTPQIEGLSVSELMQQVEMAVKTAFPRSVWVVGEIQNIAERNLGLFFQLSEQKTGGKSNSATMSVKVTLWNNVLIQLQSKFEQQKENLFSLLADGMQARLLCQVNLYKDRGQISLTVMDVDPSFTKGALALAREALLKELRQKGLDQKNKQLPRPAFPFHIGLVSAEGSRAKSDFLDQLRTYRFPGEVSFCDARMQGANTPQEVVNAIHTLTQADVDLIIITRGGGSAADLRWFDDREVAMAVAHAKIPVVAAIGHHDDVCVAEEIAFQREKTPTAAADFVLHCFQATRDRVNQLAEALATHIDRRLEWHERALQQMGQRLSHGALTQLNQYGDQLHLFAERLTNSAQRSVDRHLYQLKTTGDALHSTATAHLHRRYNQLAEWDKALVSRDPMPWIKKGWTQLFGSQGNITSTSQLEIGTSLKARLTDGQIHVKVHQIDKEKQSD